MVNYINKFNGQFAITFIDSKTDSIYLIRDRLGRNLFTLYQIVIYFWFEFNISFKVIKK